jgi:hypothetical protein
MTLKGAFSHRINGMNPGTNPGLCSAASGGELIPERIKNEKLICENQSHPGLPCSIFIIHGLVFFQLVLELLRELIELWTYDPLTISLRAVPGIVVLMVVLSFIEFRKRADFCDNRI